MKRFSLISVFVLVALLTTAQGTAATSYSYKLSVKEYEDFHKVLHPLEHDALPKKDFESIRTKANDLVTLGNDIVKLGVPRGTQQDQVDSFREELKRFSQALKTFAVDAREGKDEKLEASFSALHDSFEMLVAMLPR